MREERREGVGRGRCWAMREERREGVGRGKRWDLGLEGGELGVLVERKEGGSVGDLDGHVGGVARLGDEVVGVLQVPLLPAREDAVEHQAVLGVRAEELEQLLQHRLRARIPRKNLRPARPSGWGVTWRRG